MGQVLTVLNRFDQVAALPDLAGAYGAGKFIARNPGNTGWEWRTQNIVSVKDYGAKGDGVTDDLPAINAAIVALVALGGGILYFPPGTYLIGPSGTTIYVTLQSTVLLRGAGRGVTILKVKNGTGSFEQAIASGNNGSTACSYAGVEDLTIDMNCTGNAGTIAAAAGQYQFAIKLFNAPAGFSIRRMTVINGAGINGIVVNGGPAAVGFELRDVEYRHEPAAYTTYDNSGFYLEGINYIADGVRAITTIGKGGRGGIEIHGVGGTLTNWVVDGYEHAVNVIGPAGNPLVSGWNLATAPDYTGHIIESGRALNVIQGIRLGAESDLLGLAQAGTSNTVTLPSAAIATDGRYTSLYAVIVEGTGFGQVRRFTAYVGSTKVGTVDRAWDVVPDTTSRLVICRVIRGVVVGDNTVYLRQVAHDDAKLAAGMPADPPMGIYTYWDGGGFASGMVDEASICDNIVVYEHEGDMHRRAGSSSLEAGISMTPYGGILRNSLIDGNIVVRAPAKGIRGGGSTTVGSSVWNTTYSNNLLVDSGQYSAYGNQFDRASLEGNGVFVNCHFNDNDILDTGPTALVGNQSLLFLGTHTNTTYRPGTVKTVSGLAMAASLANLAGVTAGEGIEFLAYATPYTPNPHQGGRTKAMTLTGPLTVNAPVGPMRGDELWFEFTQDPTGGRVVTFNAIFRVNWTPDTTANRTNMIGFRFNGTNWRQISATTGLT